MPHQLDYHKSHSIYRLLFGGNQSGKSHAAAADCAWYATGRHPHGDNIEGRDVEIWVISAEYSTIKTGIYRHLIALIPDWDIVEKGPRIPQQPIPSYLKIRRKDKYETTITFLSAKGEAREKFQAAAVDYFYIDEEIQSGIWEELEARTLATGGMFSISATLVESYDWILNLEREAESGNPRVFLTRLNTENNKYLDKERVQYLKNKWSDETKEYRFYGKARRVQGIVYSSFDEERHVIKPFKVPPEWPRWCAIDPGIRTCAVLWITVDNYDRAYVYRELYAKNEPLWQVAIQIKLFEGWQLNQELSLEFKHYVWELKNPEIPAENMILRLIDPKARARSEAGEDSIISQLYERYGLIVTPADNSLRPGLEDCRFWLEDLADGKPALQVFNTCENFLEERRRYKYRPPTSKLNSNEPIEDPIRKHNHLMDCWRYIAREKPSWNKKELYTDQIGSTPLYRRKTGSELLQERLAKENEEPNEWLGIEW